MIVEQALYGKVQKAEQIFGPDAEDLDFVGQVFKSYSKGEVEFTKEANDLGQIGGGNYRGIKKISIREFSTSRKTFFVFSLHPLSNPPITPAIP